MNCKIEGCTWPAEYGDGFCLWHAPVADKRISPDDFNQRFFGQVASSGNFAGFVFPAEISIDIDKWPYRLNFENAVFEGYVTIVSRGAGGEIICNGADFKAGLDISDSTFKDGVAFRGARFHPAPKLTNDGRSYCLDADSAIFRSAADFGGAEFYGRDVLFRHTTFGADVRFDDAKFWVNDPTASGNPLAQFEQSLFQNVPGTPITPISFCDMRLEKGTLRFYKSVFKFRKVMFYLTELNSGSMEFSDCDFEDCGDVNFSSMKLCRFAKLLLEQNNFMASPLYLSDCVSDNSQLILRGARGRKFHASSVSLRGLNLVGGQLRLEALILTESDLSLARAQMNGGEFSMIGCRVDCENFDFSNVHFHCHQNEISGCRIQAEIISFDRSNFGADTLLHNCRLRAEEIGFYATEFHGTSFTLESCQLIGNINFSENDIAGRVELSNVRIGEVASFDFNAPNFISFDEQAPLVIFRKIKFSPYLTFFEDIGLGDFTEFFTCKSHPLVAFRECLLKDVYFAGNDMSLISFYSSAYFEDSFFTPSDWPPFKEPLALGLPRPYFARRRGVVREEEDYEFYAKKANREKYFNIEMPESKDEVSEIYLRLKAAADSARDHHRASEFYYNEFRMKRRAILEFRKEDGKIYRVFKWAFHLKLWQYRLYQWFAGYGEKPLWSAAWFVSLGAFFSIVHWQRGLQSEHFGNGFGAALTYTLSRLTPGGYLPLSKVEVFPLCPGFASFCWSLANSTSMLLMLVFVGVGLKRHFRRF